jgi:hypothetical protein
MRPKRPSPASIIATIALFVALGGTGLAASRYIITSTSQIKPSVLSELGGEAQFAKVATQGAHAIVARVRIGAPFQTVSEPEGGAVPLTGATWSQHGEELNQIIGQVTYTRPSEATCQTNGTPIFKLWLSGVKQPAALGQLIDSEAEGASATQTRWIYWYGDFGYGFELLFEPGKNIIRTITARAGDECNLGQHTGGHFTIDSISVDVLGFR